MSVWCFFGAGGTCIAILGYMQVEDWCVEGYVGYGFIIQVIVRELGVPHLPTGLLLRDR